MNWPELSSTDLVVFVPQGLELDTSDSAVGGQVRPGQMHVFSPLRSWPDDSLLELPGELADDSLLAELSLLGDDSLLDDDALLADEALLGELEDELLADDSLLGDDELLADDALLADEPLLAELSLLGEDSLLGELDEEELLGMIRFSCGRSALLGPNQCDEAQKDQGREESRPRNTKTLLPPKRPYSIRFNTPPEKHSARLLRSLNECEFVEVGGKYTALPHDVQNLRRNSSKQIESHERCHRHAGVKTLPRSPHPNSLTKWPDRILGERCDSLMDAHCGS